MSTLVAATVEATTLEETTSGDTVTVQALLNPWEVVGLHTVNGDATLDFFHDGWEGVGSAAFIDGWEYRVTTDNVYGNSSTVSRWNLYLYEAGVIRNSASDYRTVYFGTSGGIGAVAMGTAYTFDALGAYHVSTAGNTSDYACNGAAIFKNLGSTSFPAEWDGVHAARKNSGVANLQRINGSQSFAGGTAAVSKVQFVANATTQDGGRMILERRYVG